MRSSQLRRPLRRAVERLDSAKRAQQRVLGGVGGVLGVAERAIADVVDLALVELHQRVEGGDFAALGRAPGRVQACPRRAARTECYSLEKRGTSPSRCGYARVQRAEPACAGCPACCCSCRGCSGRWRRRPRQRGSGICPARRVSACSTGKRSTSARRAGACGRASVRRHRGHVNGRTAPPRLLRPAAHAADQRPAREAALEHLVGQAYRDGGVTALRAAAAPADCFRRCWSRSPPRRTCWSSPRAPSCG